MKEGGIQVQEATETELWGAKQYKGEDEIWVWEKPGRFSNKLHLNTQISICLQSYQAEILMHSFSNNLIKKSCI